MKKIFMLIASAFLFANVHASNVEKIQFANAGEFSLGLMVGVPTVSLGVPFFSVDGMVGIKDGFIHTDKFGDNGAIDLGLLVGFQSWKTDGYWNMPIVARSGFHFEFVKKLDVYAGLMGGVNLSHWDQSEFFDVIDPAEAGVQRKGTDVYGIFGTYIGAKWHFTDLFGVKVECSGDWVGRVRRVDSEMPAVAGGVTFNF